MNINKKTVLLFQDNGSDDFFDLESRLTALLFDKDMIEKANKIIYEENEDWELINNFKTMEEIKEALDKNGIEYEEIEMSFVEYNNDRED
jgi:hypothetical protein